MTIIIGKATVFDFPFNTPILPSSHSTMIPCVFYYVCICFDKARLICIVM